MEGTEEISVSPTVGYHTYLPPSTSIVSNLPGSHFAGEKAKPPNEYNAISSSSMHMTSDNVFPGFRGRPFPPNAKLQKIHLLREPHLSPPEQWLGEFATS